MSGLSHIFSVVLQYLPQVVAAILVMVVAWQVAKWARRAAVHEVSKKGTAESALGLIGKTAFLATLAIGLVVSLKIVGVDISFLAGAVTIGLGLAMKGVLQNYMAGLMILVQEPFKVGDTVLIAGAYGKVKEIDTRQTKIRLLDGQLVIIQNADVLAGPIKNFTTHPERRITLTFDLSWDTDIKTAERIATDALLTVKDVLPDPAPQLLVDYIGWTVTVYFWIDIKVSVFLKARSAGVQALKKAFDEAGIHIPFRNEDPNQSLLRNDDDATVLSANAHDSGGVLSFLTQLSHK